MNERIRRLDRAWSEPSTWLRYGGAVIASFAAAAARLALDPVLGVHSPYLPYILAVVVAARFGGRGPGVASTVFSALSAMYFFLPPRHSFAVADYEASAGLALFVVVGFVVSMVVGRLRESLLSIARSEADLRQKRRLLDLSHDAIISADSNRRITRWNAGAMEMYGWTPNEALGKVLYDLLRTIGSTSAAEIDAILLREERWEGELNHIAQDGHKLVVESRQVLVRGAANEPIGILEINRDVTERKRAEGESRQANEQRRLALESADMGTWAVDVASGQVVWDERCARIFGFAAGGQVEFSELIARIHPDDRVTVEATVKEAVSATSGAAYDRQVRVVWPDESVHWVALHGRGSFEAEGAGNDRSVVRFVGVSVEITERRNAEERLRQTQKLETIGLLAGGVAHDFNNLLTVIMGSASAAMEEHPSSRHYPSIVAASQRAAYLTKQLLAYAGKGQAVVKIIDLSEFVSQAEGLLAASIPKRVKLSFNLATDRPCLEAAETHIEQILMNLVINAGEAIPLRSDGLIQVSTSRCEITPELARRQSTAYDVATGAFVCLEVRDNGAGMDESTRAHIFDPFFTTKFTGRGLGLAAVSGIVRTCRGFIDVQSSPGLGTTFRAYLPASVKASATESTPIVARQRLSGYSTVLVVDDEEMVRRLACTALSSHGYAVLEARDGMDALHLLADAPTLPALVLLDLAMPVMGGDELAPILEMKYPGLKIILTSGYPEEDARANFTSGSVIGFLQKPYTVRALLEQIGEAVGRGLGQNSEIIQFPETG